MKTPEPCIDCPHFHPDKHLDAFSMRDYVDIKVSAEREKRMIIAMDLERRLADMNELRAQITRERGLYMTRELFDKMHDTAVIRIGLMEAFKANIEGRLLMLSGIFIVIQAIVAVIAIWHK